MIPEISRQCKQILKKHYGSRFQGLVVYGSTARNEATPESDLDLLVLLSTPFDFSEELRTLVDVLYPLQLESSHLIAALPAAVDEFHRGSLQLYRNALKEGVAV